MEKEKENAVSSYIWKKWCKTLFWMNDTPPYASMFSVQKLNAALQQSNAEENSAVGDKLPNGAQANVDVREEGGAEGGAGGGSDSSHVSDQDAEVRDGTVFLLGLWIAKYLYFVFLEYIQV